MEETARSVVSVTTNTVCVNEPTLVSDLAERHPKAFISVTPELFAMNPGWQIVGVSNLRGPCGLQVGQHVSEKVTYSAIRLVGMTEDVGEIYISVGNSIHFIRQPALDSLVDPWPLSDCFEGVGIRMMAVSKDGESMCHFSSGLGIHSIVFPVFFPAVSRR